MPDHRHLFSSPPSVSLSSVFFSFPSLATGGRTASVQNGANINAKDMPKMTALHRVAQRSHREVAELPLRYEADIDCLSKFHETPLDIAMDTSNTELMILLQVDGRMVGGHTRGERETELREKQKRGKDESDVRVRQTDEGWGDEDG